ncbi:hypothetical protein QBC44DRAFT_334263 [Cladorrhinum sp. PSN332]|nr:hypothetical protein QBC44DRAFT_334263 [Cladorrhinum sp. PSN332]
MRIILALILGLTVQTVVAQDESSTLADYPAVITPVAIRGRDWRRQLQSTLSGDTCGFYSNMPLRCLGSSKCSTSTPTAPSLPSLTPPLAYVGCCVPGTVCTRIKTRCVQTPEISEDIEAMTCFGTGLPYCQTVSWSGQNAFIFGCTNRIQTTVDVVFPPTSTSSSSSTTTVAPGNTSRGTPSISLTQIPPTTTKGGPVQSTGSGTSPTGAPDLDDGAGYGVRLTKEGKIGVGAGVGSGAVVVGVLVLIFRRRRRDENKSVQGGATKRVENTPTQIHTHQMGEVEGMHDAGKQQPVERIAQG